MARTYPEYDYDLAEGLLAELSSLAVSGVAQEVAEKLSACPGAPELADFFAEYGRRVAEGVLAAGQKYKDRTAQVAEEAAQKTGLVFPAIPQRYIEIWLLATRPQDKWRILESTTRRFIFSVGECSVYQLLKDELPVGSSLPCQQGCLAVLKGIYHGLGFPVKVSLLRNMEQDGNCCFCSEFTSC